MKPAQRAVLVAAAPALALGAWILLTGAMVWATLDGPQRAQLDDTLAPRMALVLMAWLLASVLLAVLAQRLYRDHVLALARLEEDTRARVAGPTGAPPESGGSATLRGLASAIQALVAQRSTLREDMQRQVLQASERVDQERRRLAALMAELSQSVVVCNLDGRVLLYNNQARLQMRALAEVPGVAPGAGGIGLGRSIHTVFERALVDHALDGIRRRLQRGSANPSAQFVTTTRGGQLLRVHMAAVLDAPGAALGGFVLMLENVTREFEQESLRDQLLHAMTEGSRGSLANLQAALDMLDFPDLDAGMRERFLGVVREESAAMGVRIQQLATTAASGLKTRWPMEDMRGADLVAAVARRIEALGDLESSSTDVDTSVWLKVDSFSLVQALASLATRLAEEFGIRRVALRLSAAGARAHLDLVWVGQAMSTETVMGWEIDPMRIGTQATPLSVRDVVERHGAAFWFERERTRHEAFFRFLLPLAAAQEAPEAPATPPAGTGARPEYYDFDLFQVSPQAHDLEDRLLSELAYTVFDTETTGLDPSAGDEIIQIGATRIVNGRLLEQEGFEQLVDPQRTISAASIPIHGIQPAMVAGKPTIDQVLPVFHAFAQDTVLVAHNAAFDMRFLQLKEAASGVRFDQPVLDTLLLSAVVHPQQESHALEAIARRLGVPVDGRHTALADATMTARVFLQLLPLLAGKGIHTLGQARAAARDTWHARLQY